MKYVVVDVYALAYRALYGYAQLTNKAGEPTSVLVGFFKQFISRVQNVEDYYPVFVADSGNSTLRSELYPEYKANRQKKEDTFYQQIDKVLELCSLIGTVYRKPGYEADDLAAEFIKEKVKADDFCLLLTVDADWLQLLARNVEVLQLKTNQVHVRWTDELFLKEWGFLPKQLAEFKAILGDSSDNIPGIKGIGPQLVTEAIRDFGTIENIYANIVRIPNTRHFQERLSESKEMVLRNKRLVTLDVQAGPLEDPNTKVTEENINQFIDKFVLYTDSVELTNILGVYLQKRKERF